MNEPRRTFLIRGLMAGAGLSAAAAAAWVWKHGATLDVDGRADRLAGVIAEPEMARFPEKANLILRTDRPPLLETPLHYFRQDLTPNDAFYVRWHESGIPTTVDLQTFRLNVAGHVRTPLSLSLRDLRTRFPSVSIVALNQCSGNGRSYYHPPVPGGQWTQGAMGNARWTGVRVRDLLDAAGVRAGALHVAVHGLDRPPLSSTPMFEKSLAIDHARDGEVMVAYAMNDQPPPLLNGFPLRLVVPGWYATYWVKSLSHLTVGNEPYAGYWMDKAYRLPVAPDGQELPGDLAKETEPLSRLSVRSVLVRPEPQETVRVGQTYQMEGLAMDDGAGITRVEISHDERKTWTDAQLDPVIDRYSWRRFRLAWAPSAPGDHTIACRATNAAGRTQTTSQWNHGGYARNVIETVTVKVVA